MKGRNCGTKRYQWNCGVLYGVVS